MKEREKSELPTISVIMLAYKMSPYLFQAANSVLENSNCELILVDPPSNDEDSSRICRFIKDLNDDRVVHVVKTDQGPAEGLNNGLRMARGNYISVLNGDDFYLPGALEYVGNYFKDNPRTDILHCSGYVADSRMLKMRLQIPFGTRSRLFYYLPLNSHTYFHPGEFFHRKFVNYLFDENNPVSWDWQRFVDLKLANPIIQYSYKAVAVFRVTPQSITGSGRLKKEAEVQSQKIKMANKETIFWVESITLLSIIRIFKYLRLVVISSKNNFWRFSARN